MPGDPVVSACPVGVPGGGGPGQPPPAPHQHHPLRSSNTRELLSHRGPSSAVEVAERQSAPRGGAARGSGRQSSKAEASEGRSPPPDPGWADLGRADGQLTGQWHLQAGPGSHLPGATAPSPSLMNERVNTTLPTAPRGLRRAARAPAQMARGAAGFPAKQPWARLAVWPWAHHLPSLSPRVCTQCHSSPPLLRWGRGAGGREGSQAPVPQHGHHSGCPHGSEKGPRLPGSTAKDNQRRGRVLSQVGRSRVKMAPGARVT